MELWVRSQDKMKLVNNCNLYISNEIRNEYVIEDLNNKYLKLGTYKTKERAIEVLDEIQDELISSDFMPIEKNEEVVLTCGSARIYEMPEE